MTIHEQIMKSENVLFSDDDILIVLDIDPITLGHVLILPIKSYVDIDEVPEFVLRKIFRAAQVYVGIMKAKYAPNGYSIMQNGGGYNDIGVFHLHVFPRFEKDEFGYLRGSGKEFSGRTKIKDLFEAEMMK